MQVAQSNVAVAESAPQAITWSVCEGAHSLLRRFKPATVMICLRYSYNSGPIFQLI